MTDVVYCFDHYEEALEGSRRFEFTGVSVDEQALFFQEAGAFLLGIDVARLARPKSLGAVRRFIELISDEYARPIDQILFEERRVVSGEERRSHLFRLFRVFAAGVDQGAPRP